MNNKIGIDLDGTVAEFVKPFISVIRNVTGTNDIPDFNTHSVPIWNVGKAVGLTNKANHNCWQWVLDNPNFWLSLPLLCRREDLLYMDSVREDIVFVTNRPINSHDQTKYWVKGMFGWDYPVAFAGSPDEKAKILDIGGFCGIIDDKTANLNAALTVPDVTPVAIHRQYNVFDWDGLRHSTIEGCLDIILQVNDGE